MAGDFGFVLIETRFVHGGMIPTTEYNLFKIVEFGDPLWAVPLFLAKANRGVAPTVESEGEMRIITGNPDVQKVVYGDYFIPRLLVAYLRQILENPKTIASLEDLFSNISREALWDAYQKSPVKFSTLESKWRKVASLVKKEVRFIVCGVEKEEIELARQLGFTVVPVGE